MSEELQRYKKLRKQIDSLNIGTAKKIRYLGFVNKCQRMELPCPKLEELRRFSRDEIVHLKPEDLGKV